MASRLFLSRVLPLTRPPLTGPLIRLSSSTPAILEEPPIPDTTPKKSIQRFLQPKLGVTGVWTLGIGAMATLISKEYIILHHESVLAVVDLSIVIWIYRRFGKQIAEYLDKQIDEVKDILYTHRFRQVAGLENKIKTEEQTEDTLNVRHDLYELEKETNQLALQVEFQRRQELVNMEVKNRLEYQLELERLNRRLEQELLVEWLNQEVVSSITPDQQRATLTQCISTLKGIASPV